MSEHHPSEATLFAYAGGALGLELALVVAAHLESCALCRREIAGLELIGGTLIETLPTTEMAPDALARALARLEILEREIQPELKTATVPGVTKLPRALAGYEIGRRRWQAPGIWTAPIRTNHASDGEFYILRAGAHRILPEHGHGGREFTQVLVGSFIDAGTLYRAGDFLEIDQESEHQPGVEASEECICLIGSETQPKIRGGLRWLVRSFFSRS